MTKSSMQPQWRYRRDALNKKGMLDVELMLENETVIMGKKQQPEVLKPMSSPTSIFSVPERMPEMKPIVLPGAWTVVGKRGKPIAQEYKMYDEPAKKKKKRSRPRKDKTPESIWALEGAPSSSKCLQELSVDTSRKEKEAARGRLAKYWARYRHDYSAKLHTRDSLLASMMFDDEIDAAEGRCGPERMPMPMPMKMRDNKKNSAREKARRGARDAKYFCYWDEEAAEIEPEHVPTWSAPAASVKPMIPAGSWELVGKGGKTISFTKPKKKRSRPRKQELDLLVVLEATPLASKCLQGVYDESTRHEKMAMRGRTTKYWGHYRQVKAAKLHARDTLRASPMFNEAGEEGAVMPMPMKMRDHKKNSLREKTRRRARDAKLALRSFSPDDKNDVGAVRLAKKKAMALDYFGTHSPTASSSSASSPAVLVDMTDANGERGVPYGEDVERKKAKKSACIIS